MSLFLTFIFAVDLDWGIEVLLHFLKGVLGKVDFTCGVFAVSLWWNAWFLWTEDATSRGAKKNATDLRFISLPVWKRRWTFRFGNDLSKYRETLISLR
jgi:hypothetical protein